MSPKLNRFAPALLLLAAGPAAAELPLDVIADTEIYIDGLFQADKNIFDSDRQQFKDDAEMRRAEVIFRGKHISGLEIMLGYDPKLGASGQAYDPERTRALLKEAGFTQSPDGVWTRGGEKLAVKLPIPARSSPLSAQ